MTNDHDLYRDWAAAYILGALDPAERVGYERHLRSCPHCQSDVKDFAALPGLLSQIDASTETSADPATERIAQLAIARASHDYNRLRSTSRRWRLAAISSTAAAIILIALVAVIAVRPPAHTDPAGTELAFGDGATGTITIDERPWGTRIELDLEGLPNRDTYHLWAVDDAGAWISAATWRPTNEGLAKLIGAAAVNTQSLDRIVITSTNRDDVLIDAET